MRPRWKYFFVLRQRSDIIYIRIYLFYVNSNTYVRMRRMYICMPTSDHRVGVINSPRTSHSLSVIGVDAVAEAALPVALRVSGVGAIVTGSLNPFRDVSGCKRVWYKRH